MSNTTGEVKGWQQLSLTPPRAVEITLRCGLYAEADHAQFQMEIRDADSGALFVMRSRPHVDWKRIWSELDVWVDAVKEAIEIHDSPFG